jgi:hypothetical protein
LSLGHGVEGEVLSDFTSVSGLTIAFPGSKTFYYQETMRVAFRKKKNNFPEITLQSVTWISSCFQWRVRVGFGFPVWVGLPFA